MEYDIKNLYHIQHWVGHLKKILFLPIIISLITILSFLPHDAHASSPQIIFHDNYSSNTGWTQVGTQITVNSAQFPNQVKFNGENGGGGVVEERVYKALPSTLPSDRWVAEFNYKYTASNLVQAEIFTLTATNADPENQPLGGALRVFHGIGSDNLFIRGTQGDSPFIHISVNTQYYARLERTPTQLTLSVFTDPARTIQVPGSPASLSINTTDYNTDLNFIQHAGCKVCGPARTLTAQLTNTTIYQVVSNGAFAPSNPTGLSATVVSPSQINLSWTAPTDNGGSPITGYKIERSADSGSTWSVIVPNTGSTATTYSDSGLSKGTTYTYRVSAINSVGTSHPSITASAKIDVPSSPVGLSAISVSPSQINLGWTAPPDIAGSAITGYKVERSTDSGSTWSTIVSNTGNTATTYSNTGLQSSTMYTYRVSAINSVGTSSPSNTASAASVVTTKIPVGTSPNSVAVNTNTNMIYVSNGGSSMSVIDGSNNVVTNTNTGSSSSVAVNQNNKKIYLGVGSNVLVINGTTIKVQKTILLPSGTAGSIAVNRHTQEVYVSDFGSCLDADTVGKVTVINPFNNTVIKTIGLTDGCNGFLAVNPVTNKIYVDWAAQGDPVHGVEIIDGASNSDIGGFQMPLCNGDPACTSTNMDIAINPITNLIYNPTQQPNGIVVTDGTNNARLSTITLDGAPNHVAVNPVTNKIYVIGTGGTLWIINGKTNTVTNEISIGGSPAGIAVNQVTNKIYITQSASNTVTVLSG
jgi:YVTN family beta-propeller protein